MIDIIVGTRPNFIKIAPILAAIHSAKTKNPQLQYRLIHTGQHYDRNMSEQFFEELGIPYPHIFLNASGGTQAEITASIMTRYEKVLMENPSRLCLVVGDVNSTMACALVAKKCQIPVAHVEAGLRSFDFSMPEEINRIVTDSISDYFFTTSKTANQHLRKAGIPSKRIFFVGNTMVDTLLRHRSKFQKPDLWERLDLKNQGFFVLTLHRPANVDQPEKLRTLLESVVANSRGLPIIFPIHPRTSKVFEKINLTAPNLHIVEPMGYLGFHFLMEKALAVITDSGGISEETTVLGVPCLTLRDNTERPETVTIGTNELIGADANGLAATLDRLFAGHWKKGGIPAKWDGKTGARIVEDLLKLGIL